MGQKSRSSKRLGTPYCLDAGELDVLFLMVQGEYPRQIAVALGVTMTSIEERQLSIRAKMGAKSATEAAIKAIKERLFAGTDPPIRVVPGEA